MTVLKRSQRSCLLLFLSIVVIVGWMHHDVNGFVVTPIGSKPSTPSTTTNSCPAVSSSSSSSSSSLHSFKVVVTEDDVALLRTPPKSKRQRIRGFFRTMFRRKKTNRTIRFTTTDFPIQTKKYRKARQQPLRQEQEDELSQKYASIESVEERAYQICLDLGLVKSTSSRNS